MALVHLWELEEASGTRVDSIGGLDLDKDFNDNNTVAVAGRVGNALNADSNLDGRYNDTDVAAVAGVDDATLMAWVFPLSLASTGVLALLGPLNDRIVTILVSSGGDAFTSSRRDGTNTIVNTSTGPIGTMAWHHIAVTTERGGDHIVYVDGVNLASDTVDEDEVLESGTGVYLGSSQTGGLRINAYIDQVAVFDTVLTEESIQYIYNGGAGRSLHTYQSPSRELGHIGFTRSWSN